MAAFAITPSVPTPSAAPRIHARPQRGRFSCGQERSAYVDRTGSFADGQCLPSSGRRPAGRFSTGQEVAPAVAGSDREGSFADGMCRTV